MKLVLAIIHDEDAFHVMDLLNENGYSVTKLASTGGFLRSGNTTLITGVDDKQVQSVCDIIEKTCKSRKLMSAASTPHISTSEGYIPYPIEVTVGGATVFILEVDQFKKV